MANIKGAALKIPHIISSLPWMSIGLWFLLLTLVIFNAIFSTVHTPRLTELLGLSLGKPFSIATHVETAKLLWEEGFHQTATRELIIAQDLIQTGNGSVLGATSDPTSLLATWKEIPSKLKSTYEYWIGVTAQKPDYRDGFLMAGTYAYQLGNMNSARSLFDKAYALDPNYKPTIEMLLRIER